MRKNKKVAKKEAMQMRAETLKSLHEQRVEAVQEMKNLADKAEKEERAFSDDESKRFDELEKKVQMLDGTIKRMKTAKEQNLDSKDQEKDGAEGSKKKEGKEQEERAFKNYVMESAGELVQKRAGEQNLTMGNNGAIIPSTIANRIIEEVKDICPIYERATMYNVKGQLKVPVWGKEDGHGITVGYQEEFTEITADSGKFTSIDLTGYLAGALALIGKSVINNANMDVIGFIVTEMAKQIAEFLEKELLLGTTKKAEGALSTTKVKTAGSATAIKADELIDVQASVKQVFQKDACWIMHPETFAEVKKLKDANNRYLLQDDYTSEFPYRLLGKPVFLSDNMPKVAAGNKAVLYGDLSGLSVNMREAIEIQVLKEKYATQHAVGVVAWFEFDSKVTDHQKLTVLQMKAA